MADLAVPSVPPASAGPRPSIVPGQGRAAIPRLPDPDRRTRPRRIQRTVLRIDAATPVDRDRALDVLRALATLGVVLGHWLVTGIVLRAGGHLADDSPLHHMPRFAPVSWVLQPLAVFFFVGGRVSAAGYASARAAGRGYRAWLGQRMSRLARPVLPFVGMWALVWIGLVAAGTAHETIHTLMWLAFSPLWFLAVYAFLTAVTPLVLRRGPQTAVAMALVVICLDGARALFGTDGVVGTVRLLNIPAGWLVPYALGVAWAGRHFTRRRSAAALLLGGASATAALILWCGYPASMVGVPGQALSNLDPPTVAAVAFGLAQCGGALLLSPLLRRLVGQPGTRVPGAVEAAAGRARPAQFLWAVVVLANLSAITVFLWHQTAMITATVASLGLGGYVFGLHTSPDSPSWALARLGWIALFAAVLLVLLVALRLCERRDTSR